MTQELTLISLSQGVKRICGYGKIKHYDKELKVYDTSEKMVFCVPPVDKKPIEFHEVYKPNSREWDYCKATVKLDGIDNELTGENVTAYECLMAMVKCWKADMLAGEVAVCATEDILDDIKKAIKDGFPENRINYDLVEEVEVVNKSTNINDYISDEDESNEEETESTTEVSENTEITTADVKNEDVTGLDDIKPKKQPTAKKATKAKVTKAKKAK